MTAAGTTDPTAGDGLGTAYERWTYGEGWIAGRADGRQAGFDEGYRAGFDAGAEVAGARVLLELEHAIGRDRLDELVSDAATRMPHVAGWLDHRARTAYEPVAGRPEYRGGPVSWRPPPARADADDDTDGM